MDENTIRTESYNYLSKTEAGKDILNTLKRNVRTSINLLFKIAREDPTNTGKIIAGANLVKSNMRMICKITGKSDISDETINILSERESVYNIADKDNYDVDLLKEQLSINESYAGLCVSNEGKFVIEDIKDDIKYAFDIIFNLSDGFDTVAISSLISNLNVNSGIYNLILGSKTEVEGINNILSAKE